MANYLSPVKMSVSIGGKLMPSSDIKLIKNIDIKYESTGASNCTITMYDPDLKILNTKNMYKENVPILVKITYSSKTTKFNGYLVDISASIDEVHTLKLNCMDESYKLDRKTVKKNWGKKKRSDIASAIFKKYGLKAVIDKSVDKPVEKGTEDKSNQDTTQSDETDMAFLKKLAEQEKYEWLCYVRDGKGYYCKKKLIEKPISKLQYRRGNYQITSFSPSINKVTRTVPVYKQDINIENGKQKKIRVTPDYSEVQGTTLK
nr:MAG TPA: hypothetical protein [Caudoviricetes sp.]